MLTVEQIELIRQRALRPDIIDQQYAAITKAELTALCDMAMQAVAPPAALSAERAKELQFNLATAQNLVDAFGGEEADVTVRWLPEGAVLNDDDDPPDYKSPAGLYVSYDDCPEEGLIGLEQSVQPPIKEVTDAERAELARLLLRAQLALPVLGTMLKKVGCFSGSEIAEELRADIARAIGHDWATGLIKSHPNWETCMKCGVVKKRNGENAACPGIVKVRLREAADALSQPSAPKPAPLSPERMREIADHYLDLWHKPERKLPLLDAVVGAIKAALAESAPSGWQPIETAPSDVPVLLYSPDRGVANEERIEVRVFHSTHGGSMHAWATHWMPLPPPPLSAAEAAKPK